MSVFKFKRYIASVLIPFLFAMWPLWMAHRHLNIGAGAETFTYGPPTSTNLRHSNNLTTVPFYLHGKTQYIGRKFNVKTTYSKLEREAAFPVSDAAATWVLPNPLQTPTRNHASVILEHDGHQTLVNILGRYSRTVQSMDLLSGKQHNKTTFGFDPVGKPLNDLNHVYSVVVDSLDGSNKEIWLPCGFHNDKVNAEWSSEYARIIDANTMTIRAGPKLPVAGGACVAAAIQVDGPGTIPHICSFGGTKGNHNTGTFLPFTQCFDRVNKKWWNPFGTMPYGLDHGSIAHIPAGVCHASDPARILIMNYRTRAYGTQATEILAFDLPRNGWTREQLESMDASTPGDWYVYSNISYTGPKDAVNSPRDASGTVVANGGRHVLNFGGIHYSYDKESGEYQGSKKYRIVRSFDVCEKKWSRVGDLGVELFALQSCASAELNIAITCGGEAEHKRHNNNPWCVVTRIPGVQFENSAAAALGGFSSELEPGRNGAIAARE